MREIRFRGKRIDNGEWVIGFVVKDESGEVNIVNNFGSSYSWDVVDPETVGENTGIRDKNGKGREMYEGDVYKQDVRYYVIEWYETKCGFIVRSLKHGTILPGYLEHEVAIYDDYEYVGSIHEHPELLEREGRT